jgi:phosphoglycerol geranylgeranyltransferase
MSHHSNKLFDLKKGDRKLGVLIDPDRHEEDRLADFVRYILKLKPDYLLLGSSVIVKSDVERSARIVKSVTNLPLILFPGHFTQLNNVVDAVLLLSLISGRNADLLIGQHVQAAPLLARTTADILSTGYMLIESGRPTSVSYISNTLPIPSDKNDIAVSTALAGEFIGMKFIYLDAGSGAERSVPLKMIEKVAQNIKSPLIVGGGIKDMKQVELCWNAGANLVIVGNALEEDQEFE